MNPCKNGVCRRGRMMDWKCDCAKGFSGVVCQSFDCKNGGKFGKEEGSGNNICYCKAGLLARSAKRSAKQWSVNWILSLWLTEAEACRMAESLERVGVAIRLRSIGTK